MYVSPASVFLLAASRPSATATLRESYGGPVTVSEDLLCGAVP